MYRPKYIREKNRSEAKVLEDVNDSGTLLRQDISEIISKYKTLEKAEEALRKFLNNLPDKAIAYKGDRLAGITRVISDMNSYRIKWE